MHSKQMIPIAENRKSWQLGEGQVNVKCYITYITQWNLPHLLLSNSELNRLNYNTKGFSYNVNEADDSMFCVNKHV